MNCKKCGSPLGPTDKFCINCGAVVETAQETPTAQIESAPAVTQTTPVSTPVQTAVPTEERNYVEETIKPIAPVNAATSPVTQEVMNNAPVQKEEKSSNNGGLKYVAIILVAIAVIAVAAVFGLKVLKDNGEKPSGNTGDVIATVSTFKVTYNGFEFSIPEGYQYEETSSGLVVGEDTWAVLFQLVDGSFAKVKANKTAVQANIQNAGYTANVPETRTLGGVEYLTLEVSKNGTNGLFAYAQGDSTHILALTVLTPDGNIDYNALEKVASIVKSLKARNAYNGMKDEGEFKISDAVSATQNLQDEPTEPATPTDPTTPTDNPTDNPAEPVNTNDNTTTPAAE